MLGDKGFEMMLVGVGGQGTVMLSNAIGTSCVEAGRKAITGELHGLSQRFGSIPCQIRFGEKIYSSLIKPGSADLIIALEPLEALRATKFASKDKTVFIVNTHKIVPISVTVLGEEYPDVNEIKKLLKDFSKKILPVSILLGHLMIT